VAAVAGAEVEAADVAAAGADGTTRNPTMRTLRSIAALVSLVIAGPALAAAPAPTGFPSAQAAADALVAAAAAQDVPALEAMLAPDGKALVVSGDDVQDRNDRARFAESAKEKLTVVVDPKDPHRATVAVGEDGWPFPAPLLEKDGRWQFDGKAGLREVVDRRVGANELDAIQICHGYVDAQLAYASEDRNGDGVKEYAQKVISSDGKRDGLVWKGADGSLEGPVSEAIARAISEGYKDRTKPYHGYNFRVLKRQGKNAHLGAMDYVVQGRMIGGFALVAWPASYRVSGVQTFIVSHDGVVYEKDLGPDTARIASGMTTFDPGKGWKPVP
jgi:Protein of unknown function (DUF2950)